MAQEKEHKQPPAYGGQAVIEGVMIRGKSSVATSCRRKDGSITTQARPLRALLVRYPWLNRPLLRGTFALWDALSMGFGGLLWSANLALEDEGEQQLSRRGFALTVAVALLIGVLLFVLLPSLITPRLGKSSLLPNLVEGLVRNGIFVLYVIIVMQLRDVQRLFAYHGAEHKVVNAFESGSEHPVVEAYSRLHRRCGTTFIAVVILVGILVHMVMGWPVWYWRLLSRLAVLPVIAGISYEIIRLAGRYDHPVLWALVWPGLLVQRLTTREPSPDMIEVARSALDAVRQADAVPGG